MTPIDISHSEEIFTVSRLNREIRMILEGSFPLLWVEGEISNFAAPGSGHWYFSLKDGLAQVRCAMFRPQNRKLDFIPRDGMHVVIKAKVSLYEGRGEFQLLAEFMEETGEGKLRQAFEALKKRLLAEGLFESSHKKPFPTVPKSIGIVTSPTGAAIRDVLSVLKRRSPQVPVIIYPTLVQGSLAAQNIVSALRIANQRKECDVIILTRGGGSLEDLWSFNEEIVARAIYQSEIPIISGVGHEIDFTIADFVADQRAPTPSAAAELITPDRVELLQTLLNQEQRLMQCLLHKLHHLQQQLAWVGKHLQQQHPKRRLAEQAQHLDYSEALLKRLQMKLLHQYEGKLATTKATLLGLNPLTKIRDLSHRLAMEQNRLQRAMRNLLGMQQQHLVKLVSQLEGISPLATLKRGYSITTCQINQHILQSISQVKPGDDIEVKLIDGYLNCKVNAVTPES